MKKIFIIAIVFTMLIPSLAFAETKIPSLEQVDAKYSIDAPVLSEDGEVQSPDDELKLNEPVVTNNTEIELIESTKIYKKMKLTDLETGEIEYLESFEGKKPYYEVTTSDEHLKIEVEENKLGFIEIKMTDLETNETETISEVLEVENAPEFGVQNAKDGYNWAYSYTNSASINRATKSAIIAIVAGFAKVNPAVNAAITVGTYFYGIKAPHVYSITGVWSKYEGKQYVDFRSYTNYYRYHDHTGYAGQVIKNWKVYSRM